MPNQNAVVYVYVSVVNAVSGQGHTLVHQLLLTTLTLSVNICVDHTHR